MVVFSSKIIQTLRPPASDTHSSKSTPYKHHLLRILQEIRPMIPGLHYSEPMTDFFRVWEVPSHLGPEGLVRSECGEDLLDNLTTQRVPGVCIVSENSIVFDLVLGPGLQVIH
jgi:hypothetical protein